MITFNETSPQWHRNWLGSSQWQLGISSWKGRLVIAFGHQLGIAMGIDIDSALFNINTIHVSRSAPYLKISIYHGNDENKNKQQTYFPRLEPHVYPCPTLSWSAEPRGGNPISHPLNPSLFNGCRPRYCALISSPISTPDFSVLISATERRRLYHKKVRFTNNSRNRKWKVDGFSHFHNYNAPGMHL